MNMEMATVDKSPEVQSTTNQIPDFALGNLFNNKSNCLIKVFMISFTAEYIIRIPIIA
jgi:hypothetical protein